jgi:hypothetical protein
MRPLNSPTFQNNFKSACRSLFQTVAVPAHTALIFLCAVPAHAQRPPVCDVLCAPDPGSPTYSTSTVQVRTAPRNVRGQSTVLAAPSATSDAAAEGPAPVIAGSQTYNYAIPILNLPGRNGLNVSLGLFYNSGVWTCNSSNSSVTFNADHCLTSAEMGVS